MTKNDADISTRTLRDATCVLRTGNFASRKLPLANGNNLPLDPQVIFETLLQRAELRPTQHNTHLMSGTEDRPA